MDEKIKKLVFDLTCSFPELIFPLRLIEIHWEEKWDIPTVLAKTDGKKIFLSPELKKFPTYVQEGVILHEIFHILLAHIPRMKKRDPIIWNLASDAVVNKIVSEFINFYVKGMVTFRDLQEVNPAISEEDSVEIVYYKLTEKPFSLGWGRRQRNQRRKILKSFDKLVPNPYLTKEDEYKAEVALENIIEGMKNRGKDPGILEEILILRRRKRRLPRKELGEILKRGMIVEDYSQELDIRRWYDWQTFGIFYPRPICSVKRPVIVVIDSSGSTSPWWKSFLEEVVAITRDKTDVYLIQIDAKIQDIKKITTVPKELKLKGGGGTDFKEFFELEWLKKIRMTRRELRNSLIFFFTDLAAYGVPEICPKEIDRKKFYWVLINKVKIPWGREIPWYELGREDYEED